MAVRFFETHHGIDDPDSFLTANKSKTLRQLVDEVRALPKLTDEAFFKKLKQHMLEWRVIMNRN